jgi:hypothetical protein
VLLKIWSKFRLGIRPTGGHVPNTASLCPRYSEFSEACLWRWSGTVNISVVVDVDRGVLSVQTQPFGTWRKKGLLLRSLVRSFRPHTHFTKCYSYKKKRQTKYCTVYSSRDVSRSAVLVAISVVQASSMSVVQLTYMLDDVGKHKMGTECWVKCYSWEVGEYIKKCWRNMIRAVRLIELAHDRVSW